MNREQVRNLVLIILAVAVGAGVLAGIAMDAKLMVVLSGSMTPIMLPGDVIVVAPVQPESIGVGDIVAFRVPDAGDRIVVTHRVIEKDPIRREFTTKGDANNAVDGRPVPYGDVVGEAVFLLPLVGFATEARRQVILFFIILPAAALLLSELRTIRMEPNRARRRAKQERKKERSLINVNSQRFLLLLLVVQAPFWIISFPSLLWMGDSPEGPDGLMTIKGQNLMPEVYALHSSTSVPQYGTVDPGESATIPITERNEFATFSKAPYLLPVFWIVGLAGVHPYLPAAAVATVPGTLIMLLLHPFWVREKYVKSRHQRRLIYRVFNQ
jgi:signal peptidase I